VNTMRNESDKKKQTKALPFEQKYPHITAWIKTHGWIETGQIDGPSNFILALDEGGVVWEGKAKYATIDEAFEALEKGLASWMKEQGEW